MKAEEHVLKDWIRRAEAFEREAHTILGTHESAPSRVVLLSDTYRQLSGLSLRQDGLLRQALACAEYGLFRAAHVMAWAGMMDFLEEKMASDELHKLRSIRPKWRARNLEELRESVPEAQLVDAVRDLGLCGKTEAKGLAGLLNRRNECAHPSSYEPDLNETLGYIAEILQRTKRLQGKSL